MKMILNEKSIHLILQPHSGIGKFYIARLLGQYLSEEGEINSYFIQEKNIPLWDDIIGSLFESDTLIAVRSSCFIDFIKYLNEIRFFKTLLSSDLLLFNHFIFTPGRHGEHLKEILDFLADELERKPGNNIIWENNNLGISIHNCTEGKYSRLQDFPEFKHLSKNSYSTICLPAESYYFHTDLSKHIMTGQTFDQAIHNSQNNLIYRQRLYWIKKRIFEAIENGISRA